MADYDYSADAAKQAALKLEIAAAIKEQDGCANYATNLALGQARRAACHARVRGILVDLLGEGVVPALPWANDIHLVDVAGKSVSAAKWAGYVRVDVAPA